jgi:hypothetical protein
MEFIMQLDEIFKNWEIDSKILPTDLANEAMKIPSLHNKYLNAHSLEKLKLKNLEISRKKLQLAKWEYYTGSMDRDEIISRGWELLSLKILKSEAERYLEADSEITDLDLKIAYQKEKVEVLSSIINTLNNRNFIIKNAIDYLKFQNGS